MKILMLGWEYPPNISGGLGVACHGLSEALRHEGVEITFVVPHLSGAEEKSEVELLSASRINIEPSAPVEKPQRELPVGTTGYAAHTTSEIIRVESTLSPYNFAHIEGHLSVIEQWNASLLQNTQRHKQDGGNVTGEKESIHFSLKGGYGPGLLQEVERYALIIEQLAKNISFDVIHAHDWMTFPAAMKARDVSGKPLVIHFHATEYDRAGESGSPQVYHIERSAINAANRVIAVSGWTSKLLVSKYLVDDSKVDIVHNGIIKSGKGVVRTRSPLGEKIITFLGRITFQKGPEYFVRAAAKVLAQFPDCHFVMAGSGDALPQMIKMVAGSGMSSRFHFTGFLSKHETEQLLSFSSVYVMPSVSEPFGLTPLEAIQAGVPVVISKQSGVSEVMNHALKVDFWNVDELVGAITSIMKHKSLADTLRENAQKDVQAISWQAAAQKIKCIYDEAITNK
jgi:glycosyltransferase involved in cell wall biosynthesis